MKAFQDYKVFQDSHALTLTVYERTLRFPRQEMFGLSSQMQRAASSIPTNMAEGSVKSEREFRQASKTALGSAAELEYQVLLARDLGYLTTEDHDELAKRVVGVKKMLSAFIRTIDRSLGAG